MRDRRRASVAMASTKDLKQPPTWVSSLYTPVTVWGHRCFSGEKLGNERRNVSSWKENTPGWGEATRSTSRVIPTWPMGVFSWGEEARQCRGSQRRKTRLSSRRALSPVSRWLWGIAEAENTRIQFVPEKSFKSDRAIQRVCMERAGSRSEKHSISGSLGGRDPVKTFFVCSSDVSPSGKRAGKTRAGAHIAAESILK